jgi:hypothetical protein
VTWIQTVHDNYEWINLAHAQQIRIIPHGWVDEEENSYRVMADYIHGNVTRTYELHRVSSIEVAEEWVHRLLARELWRPETGS